MLLEESEILSPENMPMGAILSEGASRALISEEDSEVAEMATEKIVKKAEEKFLESGKTRVTEKEVKEIIEETKQEKREKSERTAAKGRR